jgi:hypothetical protein
VCMPALSESVGLCFRIDLVLRSHQCVKAGYELFAGGKLCTVFSAVNYCGYKNNNAACIVIGSSLECTVKVMIPRPSVAAGGSNNFIDLLTCIGNKQLSRHQILERAKVLTKSSLGNEAIVGRAIMALFLSYSSLSPGTVKTCVVIQPDDNGFVMTERFKVLQSIFFHHGGDLFILLGSFSKDVADQLIKLGVLPTSIAVLELKANTGSPVVDGILSVRECVANIGAHELFVVTSDFNTDSIKMAYDCVFGRVRVVQTQTMDLGFYQYRKALDIDESAKAMRILNNLGFHARTPVESRSQK